MDRVNCRKNCGVGFTLLVHCSTGIVVLTTNILFGNGGITFQAPFGLRKDSVTQLRHFPTRTWARQWKYAVFRTQKV